MKCDSMFNMDNLGLLSVLKFSQNLKQYLIKYVMYK